ncbi:hypothetical protein BU16DRAFT_526967 [Lophium mytilinum]|uniref:Uncharacterized protein n=1 Tax=Lophium mytilinum TaxID=390894 RepID=A0A6A6QSF6_9PEZI|nr:hypothetical protein BU16DRAFT_526967 [Lophium mytilinum]
MGVGGRLGICKILQARNNGSSQRSSLTTGQRGSDDCISGPMPPPTVMLRTTPQHHRTPHFPPLKAHPHRTIQSPPSVPISYRSQSLNLHTRLQARTPFRTCSEVFPTAPISSTRP